MQWISLTSSALNDAKAAPLIAAVQTTCLATSQTDPTPNLIAAVCEEIRGAVGFNGKYSVSATVLTIPPNLKDMAVQKIIRVCKRRLEQTLTQDDRDDESTYQKRIMALTRGEFPVDQPDDPLGISPSQPLGLVSSVTPPTRRFTRELTDNL